MRGNSIAHQRHPSIILYPYASMASRGVRVVSFDRWPFLLQGHVPTTPIMLISKPIFGNPSLLLITTPLHTHNEPMINPRTYATKSRSRSVERLRLRLSWCRGPSGGADGPRRDAHPTNQREVAHYGYNAPYAEMETSNDF